MFGFIKKQKEKDNTNDKTEKINMQLVHGILACTEEYKSGEYAKVPIYLRHEIVYSGLESIFRVYGQTFLKLNFYEAEALCDVDHDVTVTLDCFFSKDIKVIKKLSWADLSEFVMASFSSVESMEDFEKAKKFGYDRFAFLKYCNLVKELGYTEEFARITFKSGIKQINLLKDLAKENVSKETMILLLTDTQ